MAKIKIEADLKAFRAELRRKMMYTKQSEAAALNDATLKVLIGAKGVKGAVQLTPKATTARIKRDLGRKYPVFDSRSASRAKAGARKGRVNPGRQVKLLFILAAKALKKRGVKGVSFAQWRMEVAMMSEAIFKARDQSRAFLAAGWLLAVLHILQAMGRQAMARGNKRSLRAAGGATAGKLFPGGAASKGYGKAATANRLVSYAYNNAAGEPGSSGYKVAEQALNQAVINATADIATYVQRKIDADLTAMSRKE